MHPCFSAGSIAGELQFLWKPLNIAAFLYIHSCPRRLAPVSAPSLRMYASGGHPCRNKSGKEAACDSIPLDYTEMTGESQGKSGTDSFVNILATCIPHLPLHFTDRRTGAAGPPAAPVRRLVRFHGQLQRHLLIDGSDFVYAYLLIKSGSCFSGHFSEVLPGKMESGACHNSLLTYSHTFVIIIPKRIGTSLKSG